MVRGDASRMLQGVAATAAAAALAESFDTGAWDNPVVFAAAVAAARRAFRGSPR